MKYRLAQVNADSFYLHEMTLRLTITLYVESFKRRTIPLTARFWTRGGQVIVVELMARSLLLIE